MAESSYILGQVIARGGMAEVFRGLHVGKDGFQRLVAIKRILPQHASNGEYAAMFRDEAHIGQRLQHANIVKVEGYEVIEGSPAIVMEFVDGSDLRAILAEVEKSKSLKRLPVAASIFIIAEAARGLHYAHNRRDDVSGRPLEIVHRDISPQNVLISFNGEIKVTDFGIASADQDFKNTETRAGIVKGKYSYMSPEQISAKKVDPRSDVFALSIVFWEVLAMRRMFAADSEVEVIEMVKNCRIPGRLVDYNPEVTDELEAIVLKGLARDPARRFASMDEMERALRALLAKSYPTFSVGDLASLMKQSLANRHDASQEEIKKMLTSSSLKSAAKSNISSLELELAEPEIIKGAAQQFNVARRGNSNDPNFRRPAGLSSSAVTRGPASIQPGGQRGSNYKQSSNKRAQSPSWVGPAWFVGIVSIVIAGIVFKTQMNSAKDGLVGQLRVTPNVVRIKVNGKPIQNGRFIRTPASVRLDPGPNLIEIARSGYASETISIDTAQNEQRVTQVLTLKPKATFSPARIILTGNAVLQIIVNEGFATGTLSPQQPVMEVKDLQDGILGNVLVMEKGKQPFRCRFTPTKSTAKRPFILMINADHGMCETRSPRDRGEP